MKRLTPVEWRSLRSDARCKRNIDTRQWVPNNEHKPKADRRKGTKFWISKCV